MHPRTGRRLSVLGNALLLRPGAEARGRVVLLHTAQSGNLHPTARYGLAISVPVPSLNLCQGA